MSGVFVDLSNASVGPQYLLGTWAVQRFADGKKQTVPSPGAFLVAAVFCVVWAASGPHFAYSNSWQLVANTVTNVATFLLVFLIQYSQNRNTQATQLKLDELVRAAQGARNQMIRLEELPDAELDRLEREMRALRSRSPHSPT